MTTPAKHTPGPWKLESVDTSSGSCHKIGPFPNRGLRENYACVYADGVKVGELGRNAIGEELLANAHLIAAAPDLLTLVRDLYEFSDPAVQRKDSAEWAEIQERALAMLRKHEAIP